LAVPRRNPCFTYSVLIGFRPKVVGVTVYGGKKPEQKERIWLS
jgi:hypothetical protein